MSDATFGVRVEPDLKAKLQETIEKSGKPGKEVMADMLLAYEERTQESQGRLPKQLTGVQQHLRRLEELYLDLYKSGEDQTQQYQSEIAELQSQIKSLKVTLVDTEKEAKAKIASIESELKSTKSTSEQQLKEMRDALENVQSSEKQSRRMAELQEEAAFSAKKQLEELSSRVEAADKLAEDYGQTKRQLADVARERDQLQEALSKATEAMDASRKEHEEELSKKLEAAQERASIALEKAVLAAERKALEEKGQVQQNLIEQIGQLQTALSECREKNAQLEITRAKGE